eukprot:GHRR01015224.1.p1 GENE.GHRR01015224.1~~GHRR01015224.1.p1  ORF type:complete len:274 (+),score=93.52 GHRR01015224.1:474-1295(+)
MVFPKTLGGDVAGIVEEADEGSKFKKGDRVIALTWGYLNTQDGAWAEYHVVKEEFLAKLPATIPLNTAGGIPLVSLTAWQALHEGNPQPGKSVLVHAAAGGVGTFAVQIAKALGLIVVGTCGPDNINFVKSELGADEVVNYRTDDVAALYKDKPFDIVIDPMGSRGDAMARSLAVLKQDTGHYSHIANASTDYEALNNAKEAHEAGKGPSVSYIAVQPNGEQLGQILGLMEAGKVKLIVDKSLPLFGGAGEAMERVAAGHVRGKVVLVVVDDE